MTGGDPRPPGNICMTWVKICGMTNAEDALAAVHAGADAVGFVFYQKSPRCVTAEAVREIVKELPESVEKIGVFVNGAGLNWQPSLLEVGITGVQLHLISESVEPLGPGKATGRAALPSAFRFLPALPIGRMLEAGVDAEGLARDFEHLRGGLPGPGLPAGVLDVMVFDSGTAQIPGGTGKTWDWEKIRPMAEAMTRGGVKLVVAGGLTPDNVSGAMQVLHPWGVDVVSGVEARPGKKDPGKMQAFVRAVRERDGRRG